jgi:hypothetical protein
MREPSRENGDLRLACSASPRIDAAGGVTIEKRCTSGVAVAPSRRIWLIANYPAASASTSEAIASTRECSAEGALTPCDEAIA